MTAPTETPAPQGPSEAQVVRGEPTEVQLVDGTSVSILFDLATVYDLEERYGSLDDMQLALAGASEKHPGEFRQTMAVLHMALVEQDRARFPHPRDLAKALSIKGVKQYADVVGVALEVAFDLQADADAADPQNPTGETAADSPGATGTTPPPSSSDEPTSPGGA